ncbi:MAG: type II toxin-antitoxin system RelE/ParE family toxin [Bacteroidales bacterium]|nr:type II toxin-antitoxin system RelE/ParE family toxin [Bacteroidales bacterium]
MASPKEKAPATYKVRLTEKARQDIDYITGYIAFINHQPLNATGVGDALFETIDRIGQNPFAFRECSEIPTKNKIYRQAVCLSWLIIYKIKAREVTILGIIHSARKPSRIKKYRKIK